MYGTVAKMKCKPEMLEAALQALQKTTPDSGTGYVSHHVFQTDKDPNEFYVAVVFESKEAYHANAQRPETNANFENLVQHLAAEPEWHDGAIVFSAQS